MPKMKTRKALVGRFRITGTGKLKMSKPGKRHLLTHKSAKRKRQLRSPTLLNDDRLKTYKRLLCL